MKDLTGEEINGWKVIEAHSPPTNKYQARLWDCECPYCHELSVKTTSQLNHGVKSCGCQNTRAEDLTGQRFGMLVVTQRANDYVSPQGKHHVQWMCECECGNTTIVSASSLKGGYTKSCGCLQKKVRESTPANFIDLTGNQFGELTVLGRVIDDENKIYRKTQWQCLCSCGKAVIVSGDNLKSGHTTSCGHNRADYNTLPGRRFGDLEVIEEIPPSGNKRRFLCKCSCGNFTEVLGTHLVQGATKSCGHIASRGEQKISSILQEFCVDYKTQISFEDLKSPKGGTLRFDFGVYDKDNLIYLIEYQGIQHFENTFCIEQDDFEYRCKCDAIKKEYCLQKNIPLIEIRYDEEITPEKILIFKTKRVVDEDFLQYKQPSYFISNTICNFKCDKENGTNLCINQELILEPNKIITIDKLIKRYQSNPITSSVVFGGLENFEEFKQLFNFIKCFRQYSQDDIIIYTGFYQNEIINEIEMLKNFPNIIIKFGRFVPNQQSHYDEVLGVKLASDNQYAERIS